MAEITYVFPSDQGDITVPPETALTYKDFEILGRGTQNWGDEVFGNFIKTADKLDGKVSKVTGKELSENDFTNVLKTKLDGIEDNATADQTKTDIDALGIDAATVNGLTVDTAVPADAVFTDTVYTKPIAEPISYITGLQAELDSKSEAVTGIIEADANGNIVFEGNLVPSIADTFTIGTPTMPVQDLYVGANSLYVDGQKVIQSEAGTIVVTADLDQNVQLKTAGGGDIEFYPSGTGAIQLKGSVQIPSTETLMTSDNGALQIGNDVVIDGSLTADNILTEETITTLSINANVLTYTKEDGTTDTIDLNMYLDDSNLARIVAGQMGSTGIATFTRDDSSTFTVDMSVLLDDTVLTEADIAFMGFTKVTDYYTQAQVESKIVELSPPATKEHVDSLGVDAATVNGKTVNTSVPLNAVFTDTVYTKPSSEPISYISGLQTELNGKLETETVTSLTVVGNEIRYTNESGTVQTIDLTSYLDDTNLARLVSGTYDSVTKELVFTRDDASEIRIDSSMFFDDTNIVTSVAGKVGTVTLTKGDVGLGDVDNTSDINKPISTATQIALNGKVDDSQVLTNVPTNAVFTDTVYDDSALTATVATKADISSVPTAVSQLTNDAGYLTSETDSQTLSLTGDILAISNGNSVDLGQFMDDTQLTKIEIDAMGVDAGTVNGKTVETSVPVGAVFTDTVYSKPASEPISYITNLQSALDNKVDDSQVLTNVPANAVFTDTQLSDADIAAMGYKKTDNDTIYDDTALSGRVTTLETADANHGTLTDFITAMTAAK